MGSMMTSRGLNARTSRYIVVRWVSRPYILGRLEWITSRPRSTHGCRSMPTDRMFLTIWSGDSSKAKYRQRSPRRHAASAKCAEMVVFPVPAVPEIRMLEAR